MPKVHKSFFASSFIAQKNKKKSLTLVERKTSDFKWNASKALPKAYDGNLNNGPYLKFLTVRKPMLKPLNALTFNKGNSKVDEFLTQQTYWNQCFDKGRFKNFVLWFFLNNGEHKTVQLVEQFKTLGFEYATKAGISLGIEDLKIPPKKSFLIFEAEKETAQTVKQYERGDITGVERFQRLIDTWHRTSEQLKQEVIDHFEATDILNPVYMMAFSGARGNISQVRQLVGMRGLMANPQGQIIDFPIRSNFREGLTLTEYIISSYGARKGIVDTALRTANAGYLTRRLVDVAQHVIISNFDCGTRRGIFLSDMKEGNKTILSLQSRLVGRVCARDINVNGEKIAKRNHEISIDLAFLINKSTKKVFVRSALTCETKKLVCQLCYGWSLAQGNLVSIGEAIGVIAAQSIGEPGTQLTMRTFHTGGVFSGDISDQIRMPFTGILQYSSPIPGTLIRTPEGKIAFLTKSSGSFTVCNLSQTEKKKYKIPEYTLLFVRNGEMVSEKEVVAQISSISKQKNATDDAELTIKSEIEGQFFLQQLQIKETKVGPKQKQKENPFPSGDFELNGEMENSLFSNPDHLQSPHSTPMDSTFSAWNWGNAWILSGKVYHSSLPSHLFPKIGDYLNRRSSFVISKANSSFSNVSGLTKLERPTLLSNQSSSQNNYPIYNFEFLSLPLSSIIYQKIGYFAKIHWNPFPSSSLNRRASKGGSSMFNQLDNSSLVNSHNSPEEKPNMNKVWINKLDSNQKTPYYGLLSNHDNIFIIPPNAQVRIKKSLVHLYPSNWQPNFNVVLQWFPFSLKTKTPGMYILEDLKQDQNVSFFYWSTQKKRGTNINSTNLDFSSSTQQFQKNRQKGFKTNQKGNSFVQSRNFNHHKSIKQKIMCLTKSPIILNNRLTNKKQKKISFHSFTNNAQNQIESHLFTPFTKSSTSFKGSKQIKSGTLLRSISHAKQNIGQLPKEKNSLKTFSPRTQNQNQNRNSNENVHFSRIFFIAQGQSNHSSLNVPSAIPNFNDSMNSTKYHFNLLESKISKDSLEKNKTLNDVNLSFSFNRLLSYFKTEKSTVRMLTSKVLLDPIKKQQSIFVKEKRMSDDCSTQLLKNKQNRGKAFKGLTKSTFSLKYKHLFHKKPLVKPRELNSKWIIKPFQLFLAKKSPFILFFNTKNKSSLFNKDCVNSNQQMKLLSVLSKSDQKAINNPAFKEKPFNFLNKNGWIYCKSETTLTKNEMGLLLNELFPMQKKKLFYPGQPINSELNFDQHIVHLEPIQITLKEFPTLFKNQSFKVENWLVNEKCRYQKLPKMVQSLQIAFHIKKVDEFFLNSLKAKEGFNIKTEISQLCQFYENPINSLSTFAKPFLLRDGEKHVDFHWWSRNDSFILKKVPVLRTKVLKKKKEANQSIQTKTKTKTKPKVLFNKGFLSSNELQKLKSSFFNKQKNSPQVISKYPSVDFDVISNFSLKYEKHKPLHLFSFFVTLPSFRLMNNSSRFGTQKNSIHGQVNQPYFDAKSMNTLKTNLSYPFKEYQVKFSPPTISYNSLLKKQTVESVDSLALRNLKGSTKKNQFLKTSFKNENVALLNPISFFKSPFLSTSLIHKLEPSFLSKQHSNLLRNQGKKDFNPFSIKFNVNQLMGGQYFSSLVPFAKTYLYSPFEGEVLKITSPYNKNSSQFSSMSQNSLGNRKQFSELIQRESSFLQIKQHTSIILTKEDLISFYFPISNIIQTSKVECIKFAQSYIVKDGLVSLTSELIRKEEKRLSPSDENEAQKSPFIDTESLTIYKLPTISSGFIGLKKTKTISKKYSLNQLTLPSHESPSKKKQKRNEIIRNSLNSTNSSLSNLNQHNSGINKRKKNHSKQPILLSKDESPSPFLAQTDLRSFVNQENNSNLAFLLGDFIVSGDSLLLNPNLLASSGNHDTQKPKREGLAHGQTDRSPFERNLSLESEDFKKQQSKLLKTAVTKSGQIIHINKEKVTIRKGQPLFVSPKSILHKYDGDFIDPKSPVITLSYQRLKTGDIVQGIPKIEQFFEARTTKRGRLFRDSLPNLLKALFQRYLQKLPLDKAVRQSFYKIQQIIVDGVLRVYRSQGVTISDKHLEIIVKQMTSKVRILEGGQTGFFPGEIVDLEFVEQVNELLMKKIQYEPLVLGITKSSLEVDSFLSAASFQQTTRVLSGAAIARKKDFLKGLKENVILGNLIPSGTGFLVYLNDTSSNLINPR
jgi:hypothetical protein